MKFLIKDIQMDAAIVPDCAFVVTTPQLANPARSSLTANKEKPMADDHAVLSAQRRHSLRRLRSKYGPSTRAYRPWLPDTVESSTASVFAQKEVSQITLVSTLTESTPAKKKKKKRNASEQRTRPNVRKKERPTAWLRFMLCSTLNSNPVNIQWKCHVLIQKRCRK